MQDDGHRLAPCARRLRVGLAGLELSDGVGKAHGHLGTQGARRVGGGLECDGRGAPDEEDGEGSDADGQQDSHHLQATVVA